MRRSDRVLIPLVRPFRSRAMANRLVTLVDAETVAMFGRVLDTMEALGRVDDTIVLRCTALTEDNARLWDANAELRDELHSLAGQLAATDRVLNSRTVHLA